MFPIVLALLSLLGIFAPASLANNITNIFDHQPDNETLASFSQTGECMAYLGRFLTDYPEQWNRNKSLVSCQNYCGQDPASDGYGVSLPLFDVLLSTCGVLTISWAVCRTECYQTRSARSQYHL